MDRAQFMRQLESLLSDIPKEERREALDYYESYFDDAGEEREAEVIRELGSPGKVAAIIKADLQENGSHSGEYSERGYENGGDEPQMPEKSLKPSRAERGYHAENKPNHARLILLIIGIVMISPFIVGAAGGVFGVVIAILFLPFTLILALGAAFLGLLIGGISCIGAGIGILGAHAASGILLMGIGFLLGAVGLLFLVLLVLFAGKALPAILRWFTDLCGKILHKKRKDGVDV